MQITLYSYMILMKLEFPDIFSEHTQISNFMKIRPLVAELFLSDWRADITSLIVLFAHLWTRLKMRGAVLLVLHLPSWSIA